MRISKQRRLFCVDVDCVQFYNCHCIATLYSQLTFLAHFCLHFVEGCNRETHVALFSRLRLLSAADWKHRICLYTRYSSSYRRRCMAHLVGTNNGRDEWFRLLAFGASNRNHSGSVGNSGSPQSRNIAGSPYKAGSPQSVQTSGSTQSLHPHPPGSNKLTLKNRPCQRFSWLIHQKQGQNNARCNARRVLTFRLSSKRSRDTSCGFVWSSP